VGRQPSLASTLRVCPQAGKTQMKRSMRPCPAAARTSTASAQRHRRSSEIAKRHGATSTQICARPAAPSFAGDAADSRHPFIRAPEGKSRRARNRIDRRRVRRPPLDSALEGCLRVAVSGLHRRPLRRPPAVPIAERSNPSGANDRRLRRSRRLRQVRPRCGGPRRRRERAAARASRLRSRCPAHRAVRTGEQRRRPRAQAVRVR
jgi:hypothetical protein